MAEKQGEERGRRGTEKFYLGVIGILSLICLGSYLVPLQQCQPPQSTLTQPK